MPTSAGKEGKKGCGCGLPLTILLILLLANVTLILGVMWMALSPSPLNPPAPADTGAVLQAAFSMRGSLAKLKTAKEGEVDTMILPEEQLNALFAAAVGNPMLERSGKLPVTLISVKLRDDEFHVFFTKDIGFRTPFGSNLNAHCALKLRVEEKGGAEGKMVKMRLGRLNVPLWLPQFWLNRELAEMNSKSEAREFRQIVVALRAEDGKAILKYSPYAMRKLLEAKLGSGMAKSVLDMF